LAVLKLPWFVSVAAVGILSVVIAVVWHACRPILEDHR
jgi:hypothetical protein